MKSYSKLLDIDNEHAGARRNIGVVLNNLQQRARSGDVEARADLQALGFGPESNSEERKGVPKFGHSLSSEF